MLDDSSTAPIRPKRYAGKVVRGRRLVNVVGDSGSRPLRCLDFNTPTFGWGFHGSAADELAIAILSEHFGASEHTFDTRVLRMYRAFVDDVVSKFSHGGAWTLSDRSVAKWISAQRA